MSAPQHQPSKQEAFLDAELKQLLQPGEKIEGIAFATNPEQHHIWMRAIGILIWGLIYLIYRLAFDKSYFLVLTNLRLMIIRSKRTAFGGRPRLLNLGVSSIPVGDLLWAEADEPGEFRTLTLIFPSGARRQFILCRDIEKYLSTQNVFVDTFLEKIQSQSQPSTAQGAAAVDTQLLPPAAFRLSTTRLNEGAAAIDSQLLPQSAPQRKSPGDSQAVPQGAPRRQPPNLPPDPAARRVKIAALVVLVLVMLFPVGLLGLAYAFKIADDFARAKPNPARAPAAPPAPRRARQPKEQQPQKQQPQKQQPKEQPKPVLPQPALAPLAEGEQYLRDLTPTDVKVIADKTNHPIDRSFAVREVPFDHGVYLHPPAANSSAEASYPLEGGYKRMRGAVGLVDGNAFGGSRTPLTFRLLGDKQELWRCKSPLQTAGEWESFDVDLTGVQQVTLMIDCPGDHTGAGAAWLDPILVPSAPGAAPALVAAEKPAATDGAPAEPIGPSVADVAENSTAENQPTPSDPAPSPSGEETAADSVAEVQPLAKADPTGPPPAPAPSTDGEQYLRELVATDVSIIEDKKDKESPVIDRAFTVRKVPFEHGMFLHPPTSRSSAEASYRLEGGYKRLRGAVGIGDHNFRRSMSPLTFRLLGDGRELWHSPAPLQTAGEWEAFDVDLTGVQSLTLKVDCPGLHTGAHGVWLDPILVRSESNAVPAPAESEKPAAEDAASTKAADSDKPTAPLSLRDRLRAQFERRKGRENVASLPREDYLAPPQAKAPGEGERYLRDLKPAKTYTSLRLKLDRVFKLADVEYQHGLSLCLRFPGKPSHVTYQLDKSYSRFRGAAGVPDNGTGGCKSPMTLRILADGAEVWKSEPMQHSGDWASFDVDLSGVRELQLEVQAEGSINGGHAVWLDPLLVE